MTTLSMAASHAVGKGQIDAVFAVLKKYNDAAKLYGKEKVINASIGAVMNEDESFASLASVEDHLRKMSAVDLMSYAPIAGLPEYLDAVVYFALMGYQPQNTHVRAIGTPGGTGAVRHAFVNYLDQGQKVLTPDWAWGNYGTLAAEHQRGIETYQLFDENYKFNVESVKQKVQELLKEQNNIVIVFNSPAHNPTGYTMKDEDWDAVIPFLMNCADDKSKKITVLLDTAYMDYAGNPQETRSYLKKFEGLPDNMLVTMAYSMSKSFMVYGMRSGALVGISGSEEIIEEFEAINSASCRGVWSNCNRGAQKLLADIHCDPVLKSKIDDERNKYTKLVKDRAEIFVNEAKEVGLINAPFHSGFFISVPSNNPKALSNKLMEDNIFAVPLKKGVRFAVCSVPLTKVPGMASKTKKAIDALK